MTKQARPAVVKSPPKIPTFEWDGKKITRPGVYSLVPLDVYHLPDVCEGPSISASRLKLLNPDVGSPAHFYAKWPGNPDHVEDDETEAMTLGRAVHHLMLGEKFFAKLFVQQPEEYVHHETGEAKPWNNNAKVCVAWNKARQREGRSILSGKMVEQIKRMSVSIGRHPLAREFLSGQIERSYFWRDEETGIWLKWRPDATPTASMDFCNLKTTHSTVWPDLQQTMRRLAYYQEAALGQWACGAVLKREMHSYTYLFAASKSPYTVRDVRFFDEDFQIGRRMNRACLRTFAACLKSGEWPGPGAGDEGNERLGLSAAAREQINARLAREGLADGVD